MSFRSGDAPSAQSAILAARTPEQKANPAYWQAGDLVMLSCYIYFGETDLHPEAGRIGRIIKLGGKRGTDNMLVQIQGGVLDEINKFILMPRAAFRPIPPHCIEAYESRDGSEAWRLSLEGVKTFREMKWKYTKATLGQ